MTRKHFQTLADQLRYVRPDGGAVRLRVWRECCESVARGCREHNYRFNYTQFLTACGYYDEGEK